MIGRLPPLNACRAFEAAARLGSFSRAAEEMNVSAGAISHQVKILEGWIGRQLFRRRTNSVVLTDAARSLAPLINEALERLALGIEGLRGTGGATALTVSAQPDFALKWLIPRLPRFAALYPALELRLVTAYRALDLVREEIDLAVRYLDRAAVASGDVLAETGGQLRADHLLRADLTPIASPALFAPDRPHQPAALRECTLLHVLSAPDDWRQWLAAARLRGVDAAYGPKFDSYALTSEAAAQGWGVALGRVGFIEADLASGRVVAPFALRLSGPRSWFLLTARGPAKTRVAAFRAWLLREAGAEPADQQPADHRTNA
jgi:LysR family transcriptional regulator, glycine cleavage system transcriptional activator